MAPRQNTIPFSQYSTTTTFVVLCILAVKCAAVVRSSSHIFLYVLFIGENLTENLQYQDIESPVVCHPNKQPKVVQELGQTASLRCRVSIFCIVVGYSLVSVYTKI